MFTKRMLLISAITGLIFAGCSSGSPSGSKGDMEAQDIQGDSKDAQENELGSDTPDTSDAPQEAQSRGHEFGLVVPDSKSVYFKLLPSDSDHVAVEVRVKDIDNVWGLALTFRYDPEFLELEKLETKDIFDEAHNKGIFKGVEVPKGRVSLGGGAYGLLDWYMFHQDHSRSFKDEPVAVVRFKVLKRGTTLLHLIPNNCFVRKVQDYVKPVLYDARLQL